MSNSSQSSPQFICKICGQGFEQKSRLERHVLISHPESASSAADVEKVLSGTRFPKSKRNKVSPSEGYSFIAKIIYLKLLKEMLIMLFFTNRQI